jgi:tetratricopeptide (TPR) repeat protein
MFAESPSELMLLKQASELAQQVLELSPTVEFGYVALANVLDFMGHSDKGIEVLTSGQSRGMKPSWRTYFTMARLQADSQSSEQILEQLKRAIAGCHKQASIIAPYVVATVQTVKQDEEYEQEIRLWNETCPSRYFEITLADSLAKRNQFEKAHQLYTKIYNDDPTFTPAAINDAVILYRQLGRLGDAEKLLLRVLSSQTSLEDSQVTLAKLHLGNIQISRGNFRGASQSFIEAASLASDRNIIIENAVRAYRDASEHQNLLAFLETFAKEIGGNGLVFALKGEVLSENLARHQDAVRAFSDAILLEPERSDFYNGMGLALYRGDDLSSALKLFQAALKIDENDAIARYNEACVLVRMGSIEEGLASLQRAIAINGKLKDSARKDLDFANVRSSAEFQRIIRGPADQEVEPLPDQVGDELFGH